MPRQNNGGPFGMGPKTGRGFGLCAGARTEAFAGNGRNHRGLGRGFGRCRNVGIAMMPSDLDLSQRDQLMEQKEFLQAQLADVTARLEKL